MIRIRRTISPSMTDGSHVPYHAPPFDRARRLCLVADVCRTLCLEGLYTEFAKSQIGKEKFSYDDAKG